MVFLIIAMLKHVFVFFWRCLKLFFSFFKYFLLTRDAFITLISQLDLFLVKTQVKTIPLLGPSWS